MEAFSIFSSMIFTINFYCWISTSYACGGYKLYVDYFRNCDTKNLIELSEDFRPTLNEDCTIIMNGCSAVKKTFNTAQVHYNITRNGARYTGKINACQLLENIHEEILSLTDLIGIPRHCPVNEGAVCGYGKRVSIRKHRIKLPIVSGTMKGKIDVETNSGNACFEFAVSLRRWLLSG